MRTKRKRKRKVKVKAGDAISVYWPKDRVWYDGRVQSMDDGSGICEVLYDDGERGSLKLSREKYKVKAGDRVELLQDGTDMRTTRKRNVKAGGRVELLQHGTDMRIPRKRKVKAGDAISVYWPEDSAWYDGRVESIDDGSGICDVLYDDGERESLKLSQEKYKIKAGGRVELLQHGTDMRTKRKRKVKVKAGDAISVYWPEDSVWYDGRVESVNDGGSGICEVLYDDGERELLKLSQEKYKVKAGGRVELLDRVLANDDDVSKQLDCIGDVLRDMADRLPPAGCHSSCKKWWSRWYSAIESAVKDGNLTVLVRATENFASQLRNSVVTPWWTAEGKKWRKRLRSVTTSEGLVSSVEELKIHAVDWTKARRLFIHHE